MRAYSIVKHELRLPVQIDMGDKILRYDTDNSYPQRIEQYALNSGSAISCINLFSNFTEGNGFEDVTFFKSIINRKRQRVDQLLRLSIQDYAKFGGFALHINYNALFEIDSVQHIQFDHVRFGLPDDYGYISDIAIFDNWDYTNRKKLTQDRHIEYIDIYNPNPLAISAQVERDGGFNNYKGQVLYFTGDNQSYPTAPWHSVLEDVLSDSEIKNFKLRNLQNGFMASGIFRYPGGFETDEERQNFLASVREFQGSSKAGKMLVIEEEGLDAPGQSLQYESVNIPNVDKLFQHTERTVRENIIAAFNQPLALHPVRVSGQLGGILEIQDSFKFYNKVTDKTRRIFKESFEDIFSRYKDNINPTNNYSIIPLEWKLNEIEDNGNGSNRTD